MKTFKQYLHRSRRALGPDAAVIVTGQIIMLSLICTTGFYLEREMTMKASAPLTAEKLVNDALEETVNSLCGQYPQHKICEKILVGQKRKEDVR